MFDQEKRAEEGDDDLDNHPSQDISAENSTQRDLVLAA
jgi:hypothetical protein